MYIFIRIIIVLFNFIIDSTTDEREVMNLRKQIEEKYKASVKSKNTIAISTLRLIKSAIKDKDIENRIGENKGEIEDQQILSLLQYLIKQRKDSIESFKIADRKDLIEKETIEIEIINHFLPKQLNSEEIKILLDKFIKDNTLSSIKDMGTIMNYLKNNFSGSVDIPLAGKLAKELLNS